MKQTGTFICPICGEPHRISAKYCPSTGKMIDVPGLQGRVGTTDLPDNAQPSPGHTGSLNQDAVIKNRYRILNKIAQGGMGAVYQAMDIHLPGKLWAVKEMSERWVTDPIERDHAIHSFQQEAEVLARLDHPNLPRVVDTFSENERQYLVMEFIQGQTLEVILDKRSEPFSEVEVIPWALQLCDVLHYLHTQPRPIIFRDLKPSNIMIDENSQVKLIDFGIVRFFKPGKAKDTMAFGTQGYCAIEALSGQTDARSDLYSLCVVLHEMLTLHEPASTMFRLPPLRKLNPQISIDCERIIKKGLEKDREMRWADLKVFSEALSKVSFEKTISYEPTLRVSESSSLPVIMDPKTVQATMPSLIKTSRPTERLAVAMSGLSTIQLSLALSVLTIMTIVGFWFLAPILVDYDFLWNNIPIISLAAPLIYAAVPRRWVASIAHACFSITGGATIILRLELSTEFLLRLFVGALLSAGFIEIWMRNLNRVQGEKGKKAWMRELLWFCSMSVIATTLLYEITFQEGLNPWLWLSAFLIAALGWFVGDIFREFLRIRKLG